MSQTINAYLDPPEVQLSAPGTTAPIDVRWYHNISCQYSVTNINTNVVLRLEGTLNGTRWDNLNENNSDITIETNSGSLILYTGIYLYQVRFNFVSESGGTAAIVTVKLGAN